MTDADTELFPLDIIHMPKEQDIDNNFKKRMSQKSNRAVKRTANDVEVVIENKKILFPNLYARTF